MDVSRHMVCSSGLEVRWNRVNGCDGVKVQVGRNMSYNVGDVSQ